jgi:hypothetical protein
MRAGANVNDVARPSTLRASDADREHIAERLRTAASEGRLLAEELEERLETALTARTYGQLDAVVADLPPERVAVRRSRTAILKRPAIALGVIVLALVLLAAVALIITGTILAGGAWLFLGLWFFGCRGRRSARYAYRHEPRGWRQVSGPARWRAWQ